MGRQSYYLEALTDALMQKAWSHIQEVEGLGGMAKAITSGLPKLRIEEASARRQAHIDSGRDTIVGVNKYRLDKEDPLEILDVDNAEVRRQQTRASGAVEARPRRRGGAGQSGGADDVRANR